MSEWKRKVIEIQVEERLKFWRTGINELKEAADAGILQEILTPKQYEVLMERIEPNSLDMISKILGKSQGAVWNQLESALARYMSAKE